MPRLYLTIVLSMTLPLLSLHNEAATSAKLMSKYVDDSIVLLWIDFWCALPMQSTSNCMTQTWRVLNRENCVGVHCRFETLHHSSFISATCTHHINYIYASYAWSHHACMYSASCTYQTLTSIIYRILYVHVQYETIFACVI